MAIGSDLGGTPPPSRIGDREDGSCQRVDADARQVMAESIGLVPIQKRSSEVPFVAPDEPSDPTGDAAS